MVRAIAYVRDIVLGSTDEVVTRNSQVELIKRFAADSDLEVAAWFEDESCGEEILSRPGIRALLAYPEPYDRLICERIWALSRSMAALEPFFAELDRRGVGVESVVSMWDYVSQQSRRRLKSQPVQPRRTQEQEETEPWVPYRVAKPARLNFVHLVHPAPRGF